MRVVTLLPSATEIVYALGVEPVGVSHECDHPPDAADLPAVTRSRIDAGSSEGINQQVAEATAEDGVYEIDRETLAALDPDLVVTQGVCDVCAVEEVRVREAIESLGIDAALLTTDPHSLDDVLADIERIGDVLGRTEQALDLVATLETRIDAVDRRANGGDPPRVAVLDWLDPPMVAGHWIPEMVRLAGGAYGLADPGARSRPREWAEIREYDPEVLVAAPCGFGLDEVAATFDDLTDRPGWDDLTAVENGEVYGIDGNHYVNRPGPRLVDALEFFAGILHPDRFDAPPVEAVWSHGLLRRKSR